MSDPRVKVLDKFTDLLEEIDKLDKDTQKFLYWWLAKECNYELGFIIGNVKAEKA